MPEPEPAAESDTSWRAQRSLASLSTRTLLGFVAAVVAIVVISLLSYRSLVDTTTSARRMAQTIEAIQHLEQLLSILKDAETGQRGYLLTGEAGYLDPYHGAVAGVRRELDLTRDALAAEGEQRARLGEIEELAARKMAELAETVDLHRAGRGDEALAIVRQDRGKVLMDRLRSQIGAMTASERARLDERTREGAAVARLSSIVTWGGSALLLFVVIAAAVMSSRDFRRQEIESWLRAGQNQLAARTQGDKEVGELADAVAGFLARTLEAPLAAVHVVEVGGRLRLVGGAGLAGTDRAASDGGRRAASGLAEQALREDRVIELDEVPAGFFEVTSALGRRPPAHLVVAPAASDGRAHAIVELGGFRRLAAHELELLRRVATPIGAAFRSARYRAELQDLLEETRRQAEELQTQQEELKVSNEELEAQAQVLHASQQRLQDQQAELETTNVQLEEQAESLAAQRDDLARAQVELRQASRYKSEFLANMSHELRTPLNSSLILSRLLFENREGNLSEEQVQFARTINNAGNDLLTLINDILDLSRIEAGKLDVRPEAVALARLADDLVATFDPIARDKALSFAVAVEASAPPTIVTDPTRLSQILRNLLSNALKFTEQGGVTLRLRDDAGGGVAFEIEDTGIGIAPDQHETIFEAFRQADGDTNRRFGGTGLGLSISRDLARLLGGGLTVDSVPGRGSTFTLRLPAAVPATDGARGVGVGSARSSFAAVAPRAAPAVGGTATSKSPVDEAGPLPDDRAALTPGARSILIVEDDVAFAGVLLDLAREQGWKGLVAGSAAQGLALAERFAPSAIVLDVGLPDRSGLSVLDALKHRSATRHIPVHMVSVDDHAQTAMHMGAIGYAFKPVAREALVEALRQLESRFTQRLRRVLVVEDDPVLRDGTCRLLAADDVETIEVGTAREALERLAVDRFDCVVLDLSLPDRSGLELLEELAAREEGGMPPVIVYTGRTLSRDEEDSLRRFSRSIIIKGARSPERLLDEVTLFLHQVESALPPDRRRMLEVSRHREAVLEGRRILIVEDDVRNVFALSRVFEPRGVKIEIARNGREALEHLRARPGVDLVLMDVMMPEMDGLEAMREIRKIPALARLPVIALTAKAMADDRNDCLAAGASDYIAKPLDLDKLLSLVRVWMPR